MSEMADERMDELVKGLREEYNPPPPTPREEMWAAIEARLTPRAGSEGTPEAGDGVVSLEEARRARVAAGVVDEGLPGAAREARVARRPAWYRQPWGWAAAAAAVLVVGIGIGRVTAPGVGPKAEGVPGTAVAISPNAEVLRAAAMDHLLNSESLLTLVRADARAGRVEPAVGTWAESLLTQTRLLLDAQGDADPVMRDLLEDLELVLAQIVGVANAGSGDEARVRSELSLALNGLEESEVLPRIQAVVPAGPGYRGT